MVCSRPGAEHLYVVGVGGGPIIDYRPRRAVQVYCRPCEAVQSD